MKTKTILSFAMMFLIAITSVFAIACEKPTQKVGISDKEIYLYTAEINFLGSAKNVVFSKKEPTCKLYAPTFTEFKNFISKREYYRVESNGKTIYVDMGNKEEWLGTTKSLIIARQLGADNLYYDGKFSLTKRKIAEPIKTESVEEEGEEDNNGGDSETPEEPPLDE